MTTEPPTYELSPTDLDEDQHPTGAWTVGERIDPETLAALQARIEGQD